MTYFPQIEKIQYEGPTTENMFAFRHYDAEEVVLGKKMKDHLRFAIAYWHTMTQDGSDPFGAPVNKRTWFGETEMETAKNRVEAFFEICEKLGAEFFCFHDIDVAPAGETLEEFFQNLDEILQICSPTHASTMVLLQLTTPRCMHTQPHKLKKALISRKN